MQYWGKYFSEKFWGLFYWGKSGTVPVIPPVVYPSLVKGEIGQQYIKGEVGQQFVKGEVGQ